MIIMNRLQSVLQIIQSEYIQSCNSDMNIKYKLININKYLFD